MELVTEEPSEAILPTSCDTLHAYMSDRTEEKIDALTKLVARIEKLELTAFGGIQE